MPGGKLKHRVTVLRPAGPRDSKGQVQSYDTVFRDWPCSIETLSGRKIEQAQTKFATATHTVTGYASKLHPLKEKDILDFQGRKLHVGSITDVGERGLELEVLVEEVKDIKRA